jgi:hypothetical protein
VPPLDLDRPRDLGELLVTSFRVWFSHLGVLLALALVVVVPVGGLVDGVWAGTLTDRDAEPSLGAAIASWFAWALLIPTLVTAMHVVAVQDLGRGVVPSFRRAATAALRVAPQVAIVVFAYLLITGVGTLACVVPGIYFAVRWYFGAQAVVALGRRGQDAFEVSEDLTRDRWWETFGVLLLVYLIASVPGVISALGAYGLEVEGAAWAAAQLLLGGLTVSFTALAGTLLFFSLRARSSGHHS